MNNFLKIAVLATLSTCAPAATPAQDRAVSVRSFCMNPETTIQWIEALRTQDTEQRVHLMSNRLCAISQDVFGSAIPGLVQNQMWYQTEFLILEVLLANGMVAFTFKSVNDEDAI